MTLLVRTGRGAVAAAVILAALGCASARYAVKAAESKMTLSVKLDREVYAGGADVRARLVLHNPGREPVVLTFPSGQRYDLEIRDSRGQGRIRWSEDRAFAMVFGEASIPPGDTVYEASVRLVDREQKPLPPGKYTAHAWITCTEPDLYRASAPFEIR